MPGRDGLVETIVVVGPTAGGAFAAVGEEDPLPEFELYLKYLGSLVRWYMTMVVMKPS